MGLSWVAYRVGYAARRRAGWLERRMPAREWDAYALAAVAAGARPEELPDLLRRGPGARLVAGGAAPEVSRERLAAVAPGAAREAAAELEATGEGRFRYFHGEWREAGRPPAWHRHPATGAEWRRDHWSRLEELGDSDVKWLWELGRFGVAYAAVRAWRLTGDAGHAGAFWRLVESWRDENPPNCGAHWMCGQECAFRAIAWTFALFGLLDAPETTPERLARLVEMLAAHAERVEGNVAYAVSQKNNHAVNEALGLLTVGTLLPFLRGAARWEARGRELLEREARRQIYGDGAYVQHSLNYHRLVLQSYAWALRVAELGGRPLSDDLRERYGRSVRFLYQLTDAGGRAPNYGANDGATLFRLDDCEFEDYRPALALGFWASERRRAFEPGPWEEPLWWLFGEEPFEAPAAPVERESMAAGEGGYYTVRGGETWAFARCCVYRDRPAQADQLHLDVWWRGANVVADPGTYSYNSPPPWNNGLASTAVHNAVAVDGLDQMERGSRFTWFHWSRGRVVRRERLAGGVELFEGEHDGYARRTGVAHRRAVMLAGDRLWVVVDDLLGEGERSLSASWLLPGSEVVEALEGGVALEHAAGEISAWFFTCEGGEARPTPVEAVSGDAASTRGWISTRYLQREPALCLVASDRVALPARRVTLFALGGGARVEAVARDRIEVLLGDERLEVALRPLPYAPGESAVVSAALDRRDRAL